MRSFDPGPRRWQLVLLAMVLGALLACRKDKPYSRTSSTVTAPPGAPWQSATAVMSFSPHVSGYHASRSERVTLKLKLVGSSGERVLELDDYLRPGDIGRAGAGDIPMKEYKQLLDPDFALQFAPDGRALALSVDGGDQYRLVSFATKQPMYCAHALFSPSSGWPKIRDLVREILASADPPVGSGRLHLVPKEYPRARGRFSHELFLALEYAGDHMDLELATDVARALVRPGSQISTTAEVNAAVKIALRAAEKHSAARDVLIDALKQPTPPTQRSRAALALAESRSSDAQSAMTKALVALPPACIDRNVECISQRADRASIVWALGKVSANLGSLPEASRDALLDATHDPHPAIQVYATRALITSKDEAVVQRLRELSDGECKNPITELKADLGSYELLRQPDHNAACWAQAALKRSAEN